MADPTDDTLPVRDENEIQIEIDVAQHSLEHTLGELKDALLDKVDVVGHLEQALDDGKDQVIDYAVRLRAFVRARPLLVIGILGGLALVAGAAFAARRKVTAT